jgi:hypothetical protein
MLVLAVDYRIGERPPAFGGKTNAPGIPAAQTSKALKVNASERRRRRIVPVLSVSNTDIPRVCRA